MSVLFDILVITFDENGWKYDAVPGKPILRWGYSGSSANWRGVAAVEHDDVVKIISFSPMDCPAESFSAVCEYIVRANYDMGIPGLTMDPSDGEISFRNQNQIDAEDPSLDPDLIMKLIMNLLRRNLAMFDVHLRGIMRVILADEPPEAAMTEAVEWARSRARRELRHDDDEETAPDASDDAAPASEEELAEARDRLLEMLEGILAEAAAAEVDADASAANNSGDLTESDQEDCLEDEADRPAA